MATKSTSAYDEVKPLNKQRQDDFIWIYENISPMACESALGSHHGKDASFHFKNIEKELKKRAKAALAKKLKEEAKKAKGAITKLSGQSPIGLVA